MASLNHSYGLEIASMTKSKSLLKKKISVYNRRQNVDTFNYCSST